MNFDEWLSGEEFYNAMQRYRCAPITNQSEVLYCFEDVKKLIKDNCTVSVAQPSYPNYGWLCPRCGRGNSPGTMTCPCVPPEPIVWTC
jgi:hypothetical protein